MPATGLPYGTGFSLEGYARFFSDAYYLTAMGQTLWLGAVTTLVCLMLGFPVAFQLARMNSRWRGPLYGIVLSPLYRSFVGPWTRVEYVPLWGAPADQTLLLKPQF